MVKKIYAIEKTKDKNKKNNRDNFLPVWSWSDIREKSWIWEGIAHKNKKKRKKNNGQ